MPERSQDCPYLVIFTPFISKKPKLTDTNDVMAAIIRGRSHMD